MPAQIASRAGLGAKPVTVFNSNRVKQLPSHFATIPLFDDQTSMLRAVMGGSHITEVRTAAVSALAVRHLTTAPVRRMALFGCGAQARSHLRAIAAEWPPLQEVRVWSPQADRSAFVRELSAELSVRLVESGTADTAACRADLHVGVGFYAPCMILISLLGINPKTAFPIMMGACAFLMPVAGMRFVRKGRYSLRPALGLAVGGIPGALFAAYIVRSLELGTVRWLVVAVVLYTAVSMLGAATTSRERRLPGPSGDDQRHPQLPQPWPHRGAPVQTPAGVRARWSALRAGGRW